MSHLIQAVTFMAENVVIEFSSPAVDVRSNGLVLQHALSIPASEEYAERLDELVEVVQALLDQALSDHTVYPPAVDAVDSDDDDVSPYDNPLERALPAEES